MISRSAGNKIHFRKQPPFRGNLVPCRCDILRFFEFVFLGNLSTAPVISYNQKENLKFRILASLRPSFSDEGTLSVGAREKTMESVD